MQDFQPISEQSTARIFTTSVTEGALSGWDNRRIRAYPSATMAATPHHPPPPLKCPRCDSQNTKFCYYNNYNLSQPRHFCKSCRRYWTKGGVLRNVPIGGGCRKPKRSSNAKSRRSSAARSISDRSSVLPDSAISIFPNSTSSDPNPPNPSNFDQNFTPGDYDDSAGIFSSLMAGSGNRSVHGLNFADTPFLCVPDRIHQKPEEIPTQMVANRGENSAIDWPPAMDPGIYEIAGAAFPASYWNDTHWADGDPSLYLP